MFLEKIVIKCLTTHDDHATICRGDRMNIKEAAQRVGKSVITVRRAIKDGKLKASLQGGKYNIIESALNEYALSTQEITLSDQDNQELNRLRDEKDKLDQMITQLRTQADEREQQIVYLREQSERLQQQLSEKDKQIENLQTQLQDASQRHDTVVMQMSRMLEYERQPFWRRWFKQKVLPAPGDVVDMEPEETDQ